MIKAVQKELEKQKKNSIYKVSREEVFIVSPTKKNIELIEIINKLGKELENNINQDIDKREIKVLDAKIKILEEQVDKLKQNIKKSKGEYYLNIEDLLQSIRKDIDGDIKKKTLDEFLKNDKSFIIQRLSLINIILEAFNASKEYEKLVNKHKEINENINKLRDIKDNIIIYYKETHQDIIKRLMDTIQSNQNKKIKEYKDGVDMKNDKN